MSDKISLDDLIPNRTYSPWTELKGRGPLSKLIWSEKIHAILKKKRQINIHEPLKIKALEGGSMFSLESETSLTFANKTFFPYFYQSTSIVCIYNDAPNYTETNIDEGAEATKEDSEEKANYKKFVLNIVNLNEGGNSEENIEIVENIFTKLLSLNKMHDFIGEKYYENLTKKLLKVIETVSKINLVITLLPKKYEVNKGSLLIGPNFDTSKDTVGLNIYSSKYYENSPLSVEEKIEINILTLLGKASSGNKLDLKYNLKSLNEVLKHLNLDQIQGSAHIDVNTESSTNTLSKLIELCNGEKISDDYFSDWQKIEIDQIKNKKFNTFLVEPKKNNKHNRKLLSYSKDNQKPSRFAGYFRQLDDSECEIIWEPEWEVKYIINDDDYNNDTPDTVLDTLPEQQIIVQDAYSDQLTKINKLISFEGALTSEIGDYKMYNIIGDKGNCLFY